MNGNGTFTTSSAPVPRPPVPRTPGPESPALGGGVGGGPLGPLGKRLPSPSRAWGESDIFLGLSAGSRRGHLEGLLLGTLGSGGAKGDLQARLPPPSLGLTGKSSSSWPPPAHT